MNEPPIHHLDLDFLNHPPEMKADLTDDAHFRCFMELNQDTVIPGLLSVLPGHIPGGRYIKTRTDNPTLFNRPPQEAPLQQDGKSWMKEYTLDVRISGEVVDILGNLMCKIDVCIEMQNYYDKNFLRKFFREWALVYCGLVQRGETEHILSTETPRSTTAVSFMAHTPALLKHQPDRRGQHIIDLGVGVRNFDAPNVALQKEGYLFIIGLDLFQRPIEALEGALDCVCYFFKNKCRLVDEEMRFLCQKGGEVMTNLARQHYRHSSSPAMEQVERWRRKGVESIDLMLTDSKTDGRVEGKAEGKAEGLAEAARSIALSLLQQGVEHTVVQKSTGLPIKEVAQLAQGLKT